MALLLLVSPTIGAIRPSFGVYKLAWAATHVVVVTEGEHIDGDVSVVESWWGDLKPDTALRIPELAAFADDSARTIDYERHGEANGTEPRVVTGRRMILFLKSAKDGWAPAAPWGGFGVSIAWIESGRVYVVVSRTKGSSVLVPFEKDEAALRQEVIRVASAREEADARLEKIRAIPDAGARAKEALKFAVETEHRPARNVAFEIIVACREHAAPHLRSALKHESYAVLRLDIITAMGDAGGPGVGEDLTAFLRTELEFWKTVAPTLKGGWWNGGMPWDRVEALRRRYGLAHEALYSLRKIRHEGCAKVVAEFRDYWTSIPQLNDIGGGQMAEECGKLLLTIASR